MGIAALVVAAVLCLLALTAAPAFAATGSVGGTVTDSISHEPIEGVEVCAWGQATEGRCDPTPTGADGHYEIEGLEPGTYEVEFWADETGHVSVLETAIVESGEATILDAELEPGASISGIVRGEGGSGVAEIEVCAYPTGEEGRLRCGYTDSLGEYTIGGLSTGSYKVEFWAPEVNLAAQFFDHEDSWVGADVIHLNTGEQVEGVDADLVAGATISGTVTSASTGLPLEEIEVCTVRAAGGELWICGWTNEAGKYRLGHHAAGTYKVVFSPELSEFFDTEPELGAEDDGYPTQFWNGQSTLAAATPISLSTGQTVTGIDAKLGTPPPGAAPITSVPEPKSVKRKCRRGFQGKKVNGAFRCVKRKRHHHKPHRRHHRNHSHHASHGRVAAYLGR